MADQPQKPTAQTQHDRVTAIDIVMRYPLGFATIEHETIVPPPKKPKRGVLHLALSSDEARKLAERFLTLADSIDAFGGTKQ